MKVTYSLATMLLYLTILTKETKSSCNIFGEQVSCNDIRLNINEEINYREPIKQISLYGVNGSIGLKTLSPFPDAEKLDLYSCHISEFEEGALCSLPKLKELVISRNESPVLTRKHLTGCNKLESFSCETQFEDDIMQEVPGLKTLTLSNLQPNFTKKFFTPLKQLSTLSVYVGALDKVEPGLFCVPTLEKLNIYQTAPLEITNHFFDGCDNLREIYISSLYSYFNSTKYGVVPEGHNPFSNLTHLESLVVDYISITHLTKDFLNVLPNLKRLYITCNGEAKVVVDGDCFDGAPNLNQLSLTSVGLEDSDLEAVNYLSNLEELNLANNKLKNIDGLKNLPKLKTLILSSNNITRVDLVALKNKFPELKELHLWSNSIDRDILKKLFREEVIKVYVDYYNNRPRNLPIF